MTSATAHTTIGPPGAPIRHPVGDLRGLWTVTAAVLAPPPALAPAAYRP
ncbi:hypothetical protein [Streptomyces spiralis]